MRNIVFCGVLAIAFLSVGAAPVSAGWGGTAQDFTYFNGGDLYGKFGEPFAVGNKLVFTDVIFQANAQDGGHDQDGDTVSWDIQCNPGWKLTAVGIWAFGSFAMIGEGSHVAVDLQLSVTELEGLNRTWTDLDTQYWPGAFPLYYPQYVQGAWYGISEMDLSSALPEPAELLHIDMTSILDAWAAAGGGAQINTQGQDIEFEFFFIPEPGTLALLALGVLAFAGRRSR